MRRRALVAGVAFAVAGIVGSWLPAFALYAGSRAAGGNTFTTKPDWTAPTIAASVIGGAGTGSPGIRQGGAYYVYANVTDAGNPPSGVSATTADVSSITGGGTAVPLSAGSFSVGGLGYNYRSSLLTADAPLPESTYAYVVTSDDAASNRRTQTWTVVVDNTAPSASDVQAVNGGATVGRAEAGDTITLTFTEAMAPASVLPGWTGASTAVVVRINNVAGGDRLEVWDAGNTNQVALGTVNLGRTDYVTANRTFGATGAPSTIVQAGATITVTLGGPSGATGTAAGNGTMTWTPSTSATDAAGNPSTAASAAESGTPDRDL